MPAARRCARFATRFAWRDDALAFDDLAADLDGGGKATGKARIPLGAAIGGGSWSLEVRDVDLQQLYAPLVATRLSGRLDADLAPATAQLDAARSPIGRSPAASRSISRPRRRSCRSTSSASAPARAAASSPGAAASRSTASARSTIDATASALRSRRASARFPRERSTAKVAATGMLAPAWRVDADVALAPGSQLSGVAARRHGARQRRADRVRDAAIDLSVGSATLTANGSVGEAGDRVTVALDAPQSRASSRRSCRAAIPRALDGALHVKAQMSGVPPAWPASTSPRAARSCSLGARDRDRRPRCARRASHRRRAAAADFASRSLQARRRCPRRRDAVGRRGNARMRASSGTLAAHALTIALDGDDLDLDATRARRPAATSATDATTALAWAGTLDTLAGPRTVGAAARGAGDAVGLRTAQGALGAAHLDGRRRQRSTSTNSRGTTAGSPRAAASPPCRSRPSRDSPAARCRCFRRSRSAANGRSPRRRSLTGTRVGAARGRRPLARPRRRQRARPTWRRASRSSKRARDCATTRSTRRAPFRSARGDQADAKLAIGAVAGGVPGPHLARCAARL